MTLDWQPVVIALAALITALSVAVPGLVLAIRATAENRAGNQRALVDNATALASLQRVHERLMKLESNGCPLLHGATITRPPVASSAPPPTNGPG